MKYQDIPGKYKAIEGFEDYFITEFGEVYSIRLCGNEKEPHLHKLTPKNPGNYKNILILYCATTLAVLQNPSIGLWPKRLLMGVLTERLLIILMETIEITTRRI